MKKMLNKKILFALVAALAVASLPFVSVAAQGVNDPTPPAAQAEISNERLEKIWARQLRSYQRMGKTDEFVAKVQQLLDRAAANGKDVTAIQSALDAFVEAAKDAKPIYESANGIIISHQGFDANGKVTDPAQAKETVKALGEKLKEIRATMDGSGQALREAIKAFREANPRPAKTPSP